MTHRKILALLLLITIAFSFVACKKDEEDFVHKGDGSGNSNGGNEGSADSVVYAYNASAKTLHRENCYYARVIDELFKKTYEGDDFDELIEKGFSFCALCCPEESALYNKIDDDDITDSGVDPEDASYVINIKTEKFHELDCRYAKSMNSQHKVYTSLSKYELIEDLHYSACQICDP